MLDNHVTTKGLLQLELKEIELSIIFCTFARKIELYSISSTLEMTNSINIKKLEAQLWESADLLRADSKLTSSQYCMPVLALIFLRYAYSRFKLVEKEVLKGRPVRNGRVLPVEASDFIEKSAIYLPEVRDSTSSSTCLMMWYRQTYGRKTGGRSVPSVRR